MKETFKPCGLAASLAMILPAFLLLTCSSGTDNGHTYDTLPDNVDEEAADLVGDELLADVPDIPDVTEDPGGPPPRCPEMSYIWIANSAEGTLSKLCTITGEEMSRFITSPQGASGDPSRTSVNLHGDMVVTNRDPSTGPSSVTKFAADRLDCIDRNGNDSIDTSTGPDDVKPWGEDECMIWNTALPNEGASSSIGARATAWDGAEDPDTGEGGSVWIGAIFNQSVYQLDGDTGVIENAVNINFSPYGGAMDGRGNYWMVAMTCTVMLCRILKLDMDSLTSSVYSVPCGYGISVDARGRIWTAGMGCVNRFDPASETNQTLRLGTQFNRGIAVDNEGSVWAAETTGNVVEVDEDTVTLINQFHVGPEAVVGVAVDFFGYIWAVSQGGNAALKIDPDTYTVESFPVGSGPYTYSDMTGFQLSTVIFI
ncbi:MAG: hypothetical protein ABIJ56_07835 [Pseudomonadota bacterium]